jgi:nitrite reductase/ring-hydroxylating ferredoxin subunit
MKFRNLILTVALICFISCKDSNTVQGTYVDTYIYLSEPTSVQLNAVGGWIYSAGGLKGLIIYRRSTNEFTAYDRQCTYDPNESCSILQVLSATLTVVDSCCGSQFSIVNGGVTKGPASQSMIQYRTTYDGNSVHIFN